MRLHALAAVVLMATGAPLAASCAAGETVSPVATATFDLGDGAVALPARAAPGALIAVKVTAPNQSSGPLAPGDVVLVSGNGPAWAKADLPLLAPVPLGGAATFGATIPAALAEGLQTLVWQPTHAGKPFGPTVPAQILLTCDDGLFCNGTERFAGGACVAGAPPCDDGEACTTDACDEASGQCAHAPGPGCAACSVGCTPACAGEPCGPDGCGGTCGACASPLDCDTDRPVCAPACAATAFCGTDCACHDVHGPLPDLVIDAARLQGEILFDTLDISPDSCAVVEPCVGGSGMRKLVRFSVAAVNQGQAPFVVPSLAARPDLFLYSPCHDQYRFAGFATYALLDAQGTTVVSGREPAYCVEDAEPVEKGPGVACAPAFDCATQGIQPGWADVHGNTLDCQWLDITGVAPGDYRIQVVLNPAHVVAEASFANNAASATLTIP